MGGRRDLREEEEEDHECCEGGHTGKLRWAGNAARGGAGPLTCTLCMVLVGVDPKESDSLDDLDVDGSMILKCI